MPFTISDLLSPTLALVQQAGIEVMRVYATDFEVSRKADRSPVTQADLLAEAIITSGLKELTPDIPIIGEEATSDGAQAVASDWFWLIDPVDGTREFLDRNGEFTVNVALVHRGKPVLGVVGAPAISETFFGVVSPQQTGAWQLDALGRHQAIACSPPPAEGVRVLCSRNHGDTEALDRFLAPYQVASRQAAGSSLKLCRIAQGAADIYPRFGPTMAWDTAAAHAVLSGAGGRVCDIKHADLQYNPLSLKNPHFVALGLTQLKP